MLIPAGSAEEMEIRACAVHVVALVKNEKQKMGQTINSPDLDNFLWNRGQQPLTRLFPDTGHDAFFIKPL